MRTILNILTASVVFLNISPKLLDASVSKTPGPSNVTGWVAFVTRGADSTVKLGTRISVTGFSANDTVKYQYFRNDTLLLTKRVRAFADSTTAPAPPYDTTVVYKGCVLVERGGRASGVVYPVKPICWSWSFLRNSPLGTVDSIFRIARVIIRPIPSVDRLTSDAGATCLSWRNAHPTDKPWIVVNQTSVPACQTADGKLMVWQFCAFVEDSAGNKFKAQNSWNIPYCETEFQSWKAEVHS